MNTPSFTAEQLAESNRIRDLAKQNRIAVVCENGNRPFRDCLSRKPSERFDHICIVGGVVKIEDVPAITDPPPYKSTMHDFIILPEVHAIPLDSSH